MIFKTHLVAADSGTAAVPGTLLARTDDGLLIQCGDGPLQVLNWETVSEA